MKSVIYNEITKLLENDYFDDFYCRTWTWTKYVRGRAQSQMPSTFLRPLFTTTFQPLIIWEVELITTTRLLCKGKV